MRKEGAGKLINVRLVSPVALLFCYEPIIALPHTYPLTTRAESWS
jgi:hypothetical protein